MDKRKIIVLLVICIAVVGFTMSSVSAHYAGSKTVKINKYKLKAFTLGKRNTASINKMRVKGKYSQLVRVADGDMTVYKLKFYFKKKGKYYTKTYRMTKKYFNFWVGKGCNCYKVKLYFYE